MKTIRTPKYHGLALAALLLGTASLASAQTTTATINSFDSQADVNPGSGTPPCGVWYGSCSLLWDGATDNTGNGGGALYVQSQWVNGNDTPLQIWMCFPPYDNYYWNGYTNFALSEYASVDFDIMWDSVNSDPDFTIGVWNDPSTAPVSWLASGSLSGSIGGLEVHNTSGAGEGNTLATTNIPAAAATGWVHVSIPITSANNAGIDGSCGIMFKKWLNIYGGGSVAGTHTCYFWIDNIKYIGLAAPPPPPTLAPLAPPSPQGLNIIDDGNQYDRQSFATVVTNAGPAYDYGWIGNPNPVTYSIHIAQYPTIGYSNYQAHIMIVSGSNVTEIDPDWAEANALVWFINRQTNMDSVVGSLRYKLNQAGGNSWLYGSDTNIFGGGGSPVTNKIVAGYGGLLGMVTNASGEVGTWTMTMTGDTGITLTAPDGSHSSSAFPQLSDAQAFPSPVTVFWGTQPNTAVWRQDVVLSSVSISGASTLNADLTQPLDPAKLVVRASNPGLMFTTPSNAMYWLEWTQPDAGYGLQGASALTGPWASVAGPPVLSTVLTEPLTTSASLASSRTYNPPPIWVGYDFGNATANSTAWASGPTYDAGASGASGSVQINWTWAYSTDGSVDFTMDLGATAIDCTGGTLSFDIMIDPSSTAGGYGDYGYFQVIARNGGYGWNDTGYGTGLLTAAGGTVGTWGHVSIPLTGAANQVRALTFQDYNDLGRAITGPETIYIDNITLTKLTATGTTAYSIGTNHAVLITTPMLPSSGAGFFRLAK